MKLMKKCDQRWSQRHELPGEFGHGPIQRNFGDFDVDRQERDGDCHDRIAEEDNALQAQLLFFFVFGFRRHVNAPHSDDPVSSWLKCRILRHSFQKYC